VILHIHGDQRTTSCEVDTNFADESIYLLKMLSLYMYTFLAPVDEVLIYPMKLFCRNIFNFTTNIFFPKKKSQWLWLGERAGQIPLPTILSPKTSDNDYIDIRAVAESSWNQSYSLSSSVNSGKNCLRMTYTYLSQLIVWLDVYSGPMSSMIRPNEIKLIITFGKYC
jgi:hypothetical protein